LNSSSPIKRVRFRVKGWLERDKFKKILEIAQYIGRRDSYSIFELDPFKIKRLQYTIDDIYALLSDIEGIVEEDLEEIKRDLIEYYTARIYLDEDGWLRVTSKKFLRDILRENGLPLLYDRQEKAYKIPPYLYEKLLNALRKSGLQIKDELGLLGSKGILPRKIRFSGKLRPYQSEALEAWIKNNYKGIIALPTGAGKTVVAIAGISTLQVKTLVVVYTKEQVKQWIQAVRRFTDAGAMVGAYYGDEKRLSPIPDRTSLRKVSGFLLATVRSSRAPSEKPIAFYV